MKISKLRKCPFCGSRPIEEITVCDYVIKCVSCLAKICADNREKEFIIKDWNRRSK